MWSKYPDIRLSCRKTFDKVRKLNALGIKHGPLPARQQLYFVNFETGPFEQLVLATFFFIFSLQKMQLLVLFRRYRKNKT